MSEWTGVWPCVVVMSRYAGTYSGARWVAFNSYDVPAGALGGDVWCSEFFADYSGPIGRGDTPNDAYVSLRAALEKGDNDG